MSKTTRKYEIGFIINPDATEEEVKKIIDSIVAIINKHQEYLLLNIANEAGGWRMADSTFRDDYKKHIKKIRKAGISVPLFIDASDWGKRIDVLQSEGPYLIEADPDFDLIEFTSGSTWE